jgi:hypothetical protein
MKEILCAIFAVVAGSASAQEMRSPRVVSATVDWEAVRASISTPAIPGRELAAVRLRAAPERRVAPETNQLGVLNRAVSKIFPNVALSPIPVLLPLDAASFVSDLASRGERGPNATASYLAGFSASKFFLPGPAGYDAAFLLHVPDVPALGSLQYKGNVELQISGSSVLYELAAPAAPAGEAVPALTAKFPGIRKVLHEGFLRYTFVRNGAPYMVSLACAPGAATARTVSCGEASRVAEHFLDALQVVGGTPAQTQTPQPVANAIERPARTSTSFSYRSPGNLIEGSGYRHAGGNPDRTVYATMKFPIAETPAFANSQEFLGFGNCYGKGRDPSPVNKNDPYHCRVNDKPLRNFEGDTENYAYPWQDNFCEMRDWLVGQCPGGHGHQGQDIRPAKCFPHPRNDAKCAPHRHNTVAVRDGYVLRSKGQEALFLVVNAPNEHIRFRYLHMSPKRMDDAGMLTNKRLKEGDKIGEVGNYLGTENGTTYHLHFDIQVPTRDGWVWVSPYMTLVSAYERAIGGKGTEVPNSAGQAQNAVR